MTDTYKQTSLKRPFISETTYWIVPLQLNKETQVEKIIQNLIGKAQMYAFKESTKAKNLLKVGDWLCFYLTKKGVVGHAQVVSEVDKNLHSNIINPQVYPWIVRLDSIELHLDKPLIIDESLRNRLVAFDTARKRRMWAWFVHSMHRITKDDFKILTQALEDTIFLS